MKFYEKITYKTDTDVGDIGMVITKPLSATFREYPGASFLEKKSKIYFSVLDDVIHDRYFMTSYVSITTPVTLTIGHKK